MFCAEFTAQKETLTPTVQFRVSLTPWGSVETRLPQSSRFRLLCEGRHLNSEEKLLFVLPHKNEALQGDFGEGEKNTLVVCVDYALFTD